MLLGWFLLLGVAQSPEVCQRADGGPAAAAWLERAEAAVGLPHLAGNVLAFQASDISILTNQSDRMYPPYIHMPANSEWWFEPGSGVERSGRVGEARRTGFLRSGSATYQVRDTLLVPMPPVHGFLRISRDLNPLAMLVDWRGASGLRVAERCRFREYWRTVLSRGDGARLYLDTKTAVPVKLERVEPHYLWGQVKVEYLYTTWWGSGPVILPVTAVRLVDGEPELIRSIGLTPGAVRVDSGPPPLRLPDNAPDMTNVPNPMLAIGRVDTVRVAPNAFLLVNRAYTESVVLARDTVWLLDATQGEERARADSAWISRLFPGNHPVAVVVTDLAWPHISGVRFWVARGATLVTHVTSRDFLQRVIDRRWTLAPDALERARAGARPRFRLVADSLSLAGGALRLHVIDGVASEGALMAWLPEARFLWAGDYVQTATEPSWYATEVWQAVVRAGIAPERVAAQHLALTPWATVRGLAVRLAPGPAKP